MSTFIIGAYLRHSIFPSLNFLQGLTHFDEILQEADGIILSRGNLGIDLPPEKVRVTNLQYH